MADASLWSTNPADNDDADPSIPLPEGMAPGLVNDDMRQIMAGVAKLRSGATSLGTPVVSDPTVATGVLNRQSADARYGNSAFVDVASAATTDIGAATSANVRITGSTTITNFGTVAAGTHRWIVIATGLTLTHNNTSLILPTRANIVCGGGDTLEAISLGSGNWIVVSFQRAQVTSFVSGTTSATLATTGAGSVFFRPNGVASTSGQFVVDQNGLATVNGGVNASGNGIYGGTLTAAQSFISSTTTALLSTTGAGSVFLRPNGPASTTGQFVIDNAGLATVNGGLTSSGNASFAGSGSFGSLSVTGAATFSSTLSATGNITGASFLSTTTSALLATSAAGSVFLRPNGSVSTSGQAVVDQNGLLTVNGAITAAGAISSGGVINPGSHIIPLADNLYTLGTGSFRFSIVYAGTGTINTSDATQKDWRGPLNAAELRVAKAVGALMGVYRWHDAIARKGDDARLHFGLTAQSLAAAFETEGLDPSRYAMWCEDRWEDKETGEEKVRQGVRYDQVWALLTASTAQRLAALEAMVIP